MSRLVGFCRPLITTILLAILVLRCSEGVLSSSSSSHNKHQERSHRKHHHHHHHRRQRPHHRHGHRTGNHGETNKDPSSPHITSAGWTNSQPRTTRDRHAVNKKIMGVYSRHEQCLNGRLPLPCRSTARKLRKHYRGACPLFLQTDVIACSTRSEEATSQAARYTFPVTSKISNKAIPTAPSRSVPRCMYDPRDVSDRQKVRVTENITYGWAPNIFSRDPKLDANAIRLQGDLYQPHLFSGGQGRAGEEGKEGRGDYHTGTFLSRPAIVFLHGGGFVTGNKSQESTKAFAQLLASTGYVVFSIDYRLMSEPATFTVLGMTELPVLQAVADARAAVRFVRSKAHEWNIDTNRIAIGGTSAGAITSLALGYVREYRDDHKNNYSIPECNSDSLPHASSKCQHSTVNGVLSISGALSSDALFCNKGPQSCWITSPPGPDHTDSAERGDVSLVMVHGTADKVVPFENGERVYHHAQKQNIHATMHELEGLGHVPWMNLTQGGDQQKQWMKSLAMMLNIRSSRYCR